MIARYTSRVVVMRQGRIVEEGATETILERPRHPYTRDLLAAMPRRATKRDIDPSAPPLIEVRDLVVDYKGRAGFFHRDPGKRALRGVSLAIRPREVVAIVGESGSGKTTLGRSIAGLVQPGGGGIFYDGHPIAPGSEGWRAYRLNCQMIFQDPYSSLDPRMPVGATVEEALRHDASLSAAEKRGRVIEILGEVGLSAEFAKRYPHELSGGQRQRVAIARALVRKPAFVIADEPVSALDVTVRMQVLELLARLQERHGFSCLFISHDLGVVEQVADRVVVMRDGAIVEEGSRDAVFDRPRDSYTRRLLAAIPTLEGNSEGGVRLVERADCRSVVELRA
jgi:peptide/nickel transport system ATP-binding protein